MKKLLYIFLMLLLAIGLIACDEAKTEPTIPTEPTIKLNEVNPQHDIYYQIFVRSFADSNQDGIGDIQGIIEQLDYLEDLGITALWLLPINPSPSYHGYNVTDYYDIHPDYGTLEDFQELIDLALERDIKVVIDLVINHTSDQHPWFVSAQASTQSEYRDYYVWNGNTAFESFVGGMKDLNFNNPAVVEEVKNIMDFYLEMGVHGFRIDAAKHLFEGINATLNNSLLLLSLNAHIKNNYPNAYIVSEVFDYNYNSVADYFIGSDSVFNFHAAMTIWDKVGFGNSRFLLASNLSRAYQAFRAFNPDFIDAPFIGNHDLDRVASMSAFQGTNGALKLAQAMRVLLTIPGSPFIYYGDELGMKGYRYEGTNIPGYGVVYDEYRRQPFLWGDSAITTTWLPSDGSNDMTPSLATQMTDNASLFNQYKEMIQIRKDNPALMYGSNFAPYKEGNSNLQGYVRHYQYESIEQAVLVLHNLSSSPIEIDLPHLKIIYGSTTLEPYQTLILEIDSALIGDYI